MEWIASLSDMMSVIGVGSGILFAGIIATIISLRHLKITKQQAILAEQQVNLGRDAQLSGRLATAIEHLKDESLAIRMGALFELKKLGFDSPEEHENIVRILAHFVREHIEDKKHLIPSPTPRQELLLRPKEDVFIACDILSLLYSQTQCVANLSYLEAEQVDLLSLNLQGANLFRANLQEANLFEANLQGAKLNETYLLKACFMNANLQDASFFWAELQEADLRDANLKGTNLAHANLQRVIFNSASMADIAQAIVGGTLQNFEYYTAKQLLEAHLDEQTLLDPDLRAEYDRLKAEQTTTPAS